MTKQKMFVQIQTKSNNYRGEVRSMKNWGSEENPDWYVEFDHDSDSDGKGYGYCKQKIDEVQEILFLEARTILGREFKPMSLAQRYGYCGAEKTDLAWSPDDESSEVEIVICNADATEFTEYYKDGSFKEYHLFANEMKVL